MRLRQYSADKANIIAQRFFDHDYRERGTLKWQGFFLSDHTAALKRQAKQEANVVQKRAQQSQEGIGGLLTGAWKTGRTVNIQLNEVSSNMIPVEYVGHVKGHHEDTIVLRDKDGHAQLIEVDEIRNIE